MVPFIKYYSNPQNPVLFSKAPIVPQFDEHAQGPTIRQIELDLLRWGLGFRA